MDYLLVCTVALLAAVLTLFSGFGLGTLLLPAFAVFFPVEVAVAATAVVHLANNAFKLALVGRWADWGVVIRFGVPALLAAFVGAAVLSLLAGAPEAFSYHVAGRRAGVEWVEVVLAILIGGFAAMELSPRFAKWTVGPKWLGFGGVLSGFFGGLSGHQGALRSVFLVRAGLQREAFIGTVAVISILVDVARLIVYGLGFALATRDLGGATGADVWLVAAACAAAFAGSFAGSRLVKKITMESVRIVIGVLLVVVAVAMGSGVMDLLRG